MTFRDLDEFLVVEPLELPIRGKVYAFPGEISARSWLLVQRLGERFQRASAAKAAGEEYDPETEVVSDADQEALMVEMFGGLDKEMADDDCTSGQIRLVFMTLLAYHMSGREAAEAVWDNQGKPAAPNRETRRSNKAKSTPLRGSHGGSTGPKAATPMAAHGPKS